MSNKKTKYQELNAFFNLDNLDKTSQKNKIIIKGDSPEDIKAKALEIQQKNLLRSKFNRSTDRGFQKALQYEAARLPAYIDYEGMEYYPIISSALDLYMEECTSIGIDGKMLTIHSDKIRIKNILEDFFYNTVNVNVNLPFWTRNTVKYGDNFVLTYGEENKGITHVKQLVNYEIERFERIIDGKPVTKFKDRMTGDEFNVFEIAHFRLLGDDKYIPYGSSLLNKVRRVFRQLVMAEDAMLTYRIIRAGEKKVFKIDVGSIDEDDVEDYIYKVATKFKKISQIDGNNGQIDYRFNILGNDEDYFLPLRNSNSQTGIDTLPGADNLDKIQDIEYLRDNLFMGLGIPKPFLSFQDASGAGKNLAQFDIRFAKKVNRIQQAMIQELNKMAIVHLYLLGYTGDDLKSFTLSLSNPSTQHELLKSELMRDKGQTYTELTRSEGGIAAMSHTNAKRKLWNMSDREIIEDLKQQKMEKVIMQELQDSPVVIKKSGIFADIDKRYGEPIDSTELPTQTGNTDQNIQQGGVPNQSPDSQQDVALGGDMSPEAQVPPSPMMENTNFNDDIHSFITKVERLVYDNKVNQDVKPRKIINETININHRLNIDATNMIHEIDELLLKQESINTIYTDINDDLDISEFNDIDLNNI